MSQKKIYGLVLYTYDFYEWEQVIAVSETRKSLNDLYRKMCKDGSSYDSALLVPNTKHEENQDRDEPHYVVERMNYVE